MKRVVRLKELHDWILVLLLIAIVATLHLEEYNLTHSLFSAFLLMVMVLRKSINIKFLALFLFLYYSIPFLNISTYRGTISFETLRLFTIGNLCILLPFLFSVGNFSAHRKTKPYSKLIVTQRMINVVIIHLIIVFLFLGYVYATLGNVLVNQELRFLES